MATANPIKAQEHPTPDTQLVDRQQALQDILDEALEDPSLVEALEVYQIGQKEYARAVAGSVSVKILAGASSNPGEQTDADVDRD